MTILSNDELHRLRSYHGAWMNEIDAEIVRVRSGKPPRSNTEIAEAVRVRLNATISPEEKRLLMAAAQAGKR